MTDPLDVTARAAASTDVADLERLYLASLGDTFGERGAELHNLLRGRPMPLDATFSADIENEATHVFSGLIDGVAVGYAVVHVDVLRNGVG